MLNYIRLPLCFDGYVLNDCFGFFTGDIIERSLKYCRFLCSWRLFAIMVFEWKERLLAVLVWDRACHTRFSG
jgi:hypothetical protein